VEEQEPVKEQEPVAEPVKLDPDAGAEVATEGSADSNGAMVNSNNASDNAVSLALDDA
jgi:hypothetical protein